MSKTFFRATMSCALMSLTIAAWAGSGVWTSNGPDGGIIYEVRHDPSVANTMYATSRGGFFKSEDGGFSWVSSNNGLIDITNNPLIIDADAPGHLYVFDFGNRLYRSTDYGSTWVPTGYVIPSGIYPWFASDVSGSVGEFYVTLSPENATTPTAPLVMKTTDSGVSFTLPGTGLPASGFYSIKVDPANPQHVLVGTDGSVEVPFALYRTIDGGANWSGVGPADAYWTSSISFGAGANPMRTIYAAIDEILYRSDNSGATWTATNVNAEIALADPVDPLNVLFTGTYFNVGLHRSTDGGVTSLPLTTGLSANASYVDGSGIPVPVDPFWLTADPGYPAANTALWLATEGDGLFRSSNGGTSWSNSQIGLRATNIRAIAIHPNVLAIHPGTGAGIRVYAGFGDTFFSSPALYRSIDGGGSWYPSNNGLRASLLRAIVIDPTTAGVGSGNPPPPLNTATMYAVGRSSLSGPPERYVGAGLFKSTNAGANWSVIDGGLPRHGVAPNDYSDLGSVRGIALDPRSCSAPPVSGPCTSGPLQTLFAVADGKRGETIVDTSSVPGTRRMTMIYGHQLIRSGDAGASWVARDGAASGFVVSSVVRTCPASPIPPNNCTGATSLESNVLVRPTTIVHSPSTSGVAYIGTYVVLAPTGTIPPPDPVTGVYRTTDGGTTWTSVSTGLPLRTGSTSTRHDVLALAIHPSNDQILWATTVDFATPNSGTIYKTVNGGASWSESGEGLRGNADIRAIAVDASDTSGNTLYASGTGTPANPGAVYKSEDGGASWRSISVGLPADSASSIAVDPFNFNVIHAGTNTGIWSLTQVPDADGDGIPDGTENFAPDGGDGNGDDLPDAAQRDVGSTVIVIRRPGGTGGYFTSDIQTAMSTPAQPEGCQQAVDVHAKTASQFGRDYVSGNFHYYKYPRDLVRFEVLDCSRAIVDITFHNAAFSNEYGWSFRFFGPLSPGDDDSLRWSDFSDRAQILPGSPTTWRLTLDANQFGSYRPAGDSILFVGGPACFDDRIFRDSLETDADTGPATCDH